MRKWQFTSFIKYIEKNYSSVDKIDEIIKKLHTLVINTTLYRGEAFIHEDVITYKDKFYRTKDITKEITESRDFFKVVLQHLSDMWILDEIIKNLENPKKPTILYDRYVWNKTFLTYIKRYIKDYSQKFQEGIIGAIEYLYNGL